MKSRIVVKEDVKLVRYPLLAMHKKMDFAVLFTSENTGTCVYGEFIGTYRGDWTRCLDTDLWDTSSDFSIILSND
jgi:hypothetical protein